MQFKGVLTSMILGDFFQNQYFIGDFTTSRRPQRNADSVASQSNSNPRTACFCLFMDNLIIIL
ncbi:MAG: hypothetical protein B7Z78_03365 [Rhodospirillales bacterium 20-60-12]|nr:MAG: hypothetical protein B7Z78_03365 [Rhodospirillales bacterium 20-60-12]